MSSPDRRRLLKSVAALGVGGAVFQRALVARAVEPEPEPKSAEERRVVTAAMIEQAEWVAGITLTDSQRHAVGRQLTRELADRRVAETVRLAYTVAPAMRFDPGPGPESHVPHDFVKIAANPVKEFANLDGDDLAFASVEHLSGLLTAGTITAKELATLALERLKKYDPALLCVVNLTEEVALKQAEQADADRAAGQPGGMLRGIPWGAKDLISYPGYPTTWGAEHFKTQQFPDRATVAEKLDAAGCVLVAKLTLGALALGDKWFGGMTRNPWRVQEGSSGSSAGSAAAVAAGLVPFAIGSETLGSIVSPSTRCGVTGLRPTFGRVSRAGCMTLAWSMDKLGPICRSAVDCALVFAAIHGAGAADRASVSRPFVWPCPRPVAGLRIGYVESKKPAAERDELRVLKDLGAVLVPIQLPGRGRPAGLGCILDAECAAAFDELTRAGVADGIGAWATPFRQGRFITAVDYLRANRLRSLVMADMATVMKTVDVYVGGNDLFLTNLTGHPTVCLPNGFTERGGVSVPTALTFTGQLYGESELLAVAAAYQDATGFHRKRPPMEKVTRTEAGL